MRQMVRERKSDTVAISFVPRDRSLNSKSHHLSTRKKHSTKVVHITHGLISNVSSTNMKSNLISDKKKKKSLTKNRRSQNVDQQYHDSFSQPNSTKKLSLQTSNSTKISYLSRSGRVANHQERIHQLSDKNGMPLDHHKTMKRKKKTKCPRRYCVVFSPLVVLIIGTIIAVLLVLLLKSQTKTRQTPTATPVLRWNATGITVAGLVGNQGSGSNQFRTPTYVVPDWAYNLYIADMYNDRIQKYRLGSLVGTTIAGNGTGGKTPSQLNDPSRLLLDSNENLYITDNSNCRVQFWPRGAVNGTTVAGTAGTCGNASNQLNNPYGTALHSTLGILYIADYGNHRLMAYPPGAQNGTLLLGGNGLGTNNTQLCSPIGLHYDSFSNTLLIANFGCHNIVRYAIGATSWTLVTGNINGVSGATSSSFAAPIDITLDPMGNMYVADRGNHRIQFFYDGQMNGTTIAGITSVSGNNATTLSSPWTVRLDNQLNLYVADAVNHRIQKFLRY